VITRRRLLAIAASSGIILTAPAYARRLGQGGGGGGGFSPDGSVIVGQPGGGAIPTSLATRYGVWTLGAFRATQPGYGGGTFCDVFLNGELVSPATGFIGIGLPIFQQLWADFGGNVYGISNDQLWYQWTNYAWQTNDGADLSSGPAPTPTPPALPTYAPPYTPSAENTSISGGSGSLTTADGIFSFGAINGAGWDLTLNGIPIFAVPQSFFNFPVNLMTVYGHGQCFIRQTNGVWWVWAGNQLNPSTGPVSGPVPIGLSYTPSHPTLVGAGSIGRLVATISVTMSDGSPFSGTVAIADTINYAISGSNPNPTIVTNANPFSSAFTLLTVTQNGTGFQYMAFIIAT
jgi:hypothetical protein